ncbi:MAG: GtrA family protein [Anaerolineae bacterium]
MSQITTSIDKKEVDPQAGIRLPIDGIIEWFADKVGGSKSREVVRFLKFGFVGTLGAVIDLGTSFVLINTIFDPTIQIQFLTAATIAFTLAVLSNFIWNRYWTYPDSRSRPVQNQLMQFALVSIGGWIGRTIWLTFMTPIFSDMASRLAIEYNMIIDETQAAVIGGMTAIFIGIFVVMIWNFFVNRYWTFNDVV